MTSLIARLERRSKWSLRLLAVVLMLGIGIVDYLSGFELLFSVFYLLAVLLATWFVGKGFGLCISVLSVLVWLGGDLAAGARYSSSVVPIWNALILMIFYFIVVWLLASLRSLQEDLENRVRQRTNALTQEMAERQRLEKEILNVSEREQRRIGHDLHDGLCQHLTATALAGQVLAERLDAKSAPEAADTKKIVDLVEQGITLARNLSRGLYPVEMEAEGLMSAFHQLAANLSNPKTRCQFQCEVPVLIHDDATATHLYRIAQESISNAIRHGKAKQIVISLSERSERVCLTIEDDGVGLPELTPKRAGLGIRIMEYRAAMMGGSLSVEPAPTGGTIVACSLPKIRSAKENADEH